MTSRRGIYDSTFRPFILLFVLAVLPASFCGSLAKAQEPPRLAVHLADTAHVLGDRTAVIDSKLKAFEAATGHQLFVLTVPSTGSHSIEEYAVDVFQKSKIGRNRLDDGALFIVSTSDHKMRIEVGYGLEGALTDARCSQIIHDITLPLFRQGKLDAGIEAGVDAVLHTVDPSFAYNSRDASTPVQEVPIPKHVWIAIGTFLFLIFGLLAIGTGAMGLVVLAILMLVVAVRFPGSEGRLYSAAIFIIWFCARWKLVAHNIRQYHLPSSKNQFLTWMRCFLFMPGSGRAASQGETSLVSYSFSFGSSGRHKNRRDDEDSGCGRGGRSGGAGASGEW